MDAHHLNNETRSTGSYVKVCQRVFCFATSMKWNGSLGNDILAGHERYLNITGQAPDFGMLMIGANAGVVGTTKGHLDLALALSVSVFVVITKIGTPNVLQDNMKLLFTILVLWLKRPMSFNKF
uniref:Uncharacterized protein n=1 Tax=Glossina brevipalpis TaxID=37001 RepID=A0A1A9W3J7_9MUSC